MIRKRQRPKAVSLMLTPMIDMFTIILVYLIVHYSPEASKIKKSDLVELPKSTINLNKVPRLQVEVASNYIMLNGTKLEGLDPSTAKSNTWAILHSKIKEISEKDEPVLLISDKATSFEFVDRTIAHLAAAGYSEVYFLTEKQKSKEEEK